MSQATINLLLENLQAKVSGADTELLRLELFNSCDELSREALNAPAPVFADPPEDWLPVGQWVPHYQLLLDGALARLYAQPQRPWTNPELNKLHFDRYASYMLLARGEAAGSPASLYMRVMNTVRAQVPLVRDAVIRLEMFGVVNRVRVDALDLPPLTDSDSNASAWLTSDDWKRAYLPVLYGTLAALQSQDGKPWTALESAKLNLVQFEREFGLLSGEVTATEISTIYDRLLANLSVQAEGVRDEVLALEIFNTVNKIRMDALGLSPLTDTDTDPSTWLDNDQWERAYQAILYGSLGALRLQAGRPWFQPEAAKALFSQYEHEFTLLRGDTYSSSTDELDRLLDTLRVKLPGARDEVIKSEIFLAMGQFFELTNVWQEEVPVKAQPDKTNYFLIPCTSSLILRLMSVQDESGALISANMPTPGYLTLRRAPSEEATYSARVSLTVTDPTDSEGYPQFPEWVLPRFRETILDCVLGRMMSQIAKPYSNERLAIYHLRKFRNSAAQHRVEAQRNYTYRAQAWAFPKFA